MLFVFGGVGAGDEDVINVRVNELQTAGDFVDEALKGLSGIAETKWHFDELEQTKWCGDGSFGNVDIDRVLWHDSVYGSHHMGANPQVVVLEPCEEVKPEDYWRDEQCLYPTCVGIRPWQL